MKFFWFTMLTLCASTMTACGRGPTLTICVSDPMFDGFQCVDHDEKKIFVRYSESENYVAMPPQDYKTLLEWIKRNKK